MGKKKDEAKTPEAIIANTNEAEAPEVNNTEGTAPEKSDKQTALEGLQELVDEYNDDAELADFKHMKELKEKINEKIAEYNLASETECFAELLKAENPLKAAAEKLRYPAVRVPEEDNKLVIDTDTTKLIDPMRLYRKVKGGIGVNKAWPYMVERLNKTLCARRLIELGIDPSVLKGTYAIRDEALKLEGFLSDEDPATFDLIAANEHLKKNMEMVVAAMVGEYEVPTSLVNYVLSIYSKKKNSASLELIAANHRFMKQYMLEVCHACITGATVTMTYKKAK